MAKIIKLKRFYYEVGTLGIIEIGENLIFTLELPYKNNERNVSCIDEGKYKLTRYNSNKFKDCFKVNDVKNRSDILIHSGNSLNNTRGCILVGCGINFNDDKALILSDSKKALYKLNKILMWSKDIELLIYK